MDSKYIRTVCPDCHHQFNQELPKDFKIEEIEKFIEETSDLLKAGKLSAQVKVENIYLPLNHLFNAAAKRAFAARSVSEQNPMRKIKFLTTTQTEVQDEVRFFGSRAIGERNIFDAAKKVAGAINHLAGEGYITGVMKSCKLMLMELVSEPHELPQFLVLSYPCVSPQGVDYLKSHKCDELFEMSEMPKSVAK
jgi:hypothetical protein